MPAHWGWSPTSPVMSCSNSAMRLSRCVTSCRMASSRAFSLSRLVLRSLIWLTEKVRRACLADLASLTRSCVWIFETRPRMPTKTGPSARGRAAEICPKIVPKSVGSPGMEVLAFFIAVCFGGSLLWGGSP